MDIKLFYNEKGMAIGHICKCGSSHRWPLYVFGHWNDIITFTCPECKTKVDIQSGIISDSTEVTDGGRI
jgi:hypothetical protein